jgi:hypothetical protein
MKVSLLLGAAMFVIAGAPTSFAAAAALTGKVTSAKEGAMEGVLVTAKKDGSTMSVTVVSDEKGQYSFPAAGSTPDITASRFAPSVTSWMVRAPSM